MADLTEQRKIFGLLRERYARKGDLVRDLARLLCLSPSSVYRRMNGEQQLNTAELMAIARHFELSLDAIVNRDTGPIPFAFAPLNRAVRHFEDYVGFLQRRLGRLSDTRRDRLFVCAQELPPWLYFRFPELSAFKKYLYGLGVFDDGRYRDVAYAPRLLSERTVAQGAACAAQYRRLPSVDIWGPNLLDTTLRQIEYVAEADRFDHPRDAYRLLDQLEELVEGARAMAQRGRKDAVEARGGTCALYVNDLLFTGNLALLRQPGSYCTIVNLGNPNVLSSSHERLGAHLEAWFGRLADQSTSISVHGDRDREGYFNRMRDQLDRTRGRLFA